MPGDNQAQDHESLVTQTPECFVIMPISTHERHVERYPDGEAHFENIYEHLFKPAIELAGMRPLPPKFDGGGVIHSQIIAQLSAADLVLCDMSTFNPNVFFELGVRTALNKPVAMVRDSFIKGSEIPFDQVPVSIPEYSGALGYHEVDTQRELIAAHLRACLAGGDQNEMWKVFGLQTSAAPTTSAGQSSEDKLDLVIRLLAQRDHEVRASTQRSPDSEAEIAKSVGRAISEHLQGVGLTDWYRDNDGSYEIFVSRIPGAASLAAFHAALTDLQLEAYIRTPSGDIYVSVNGVRRLPLAVEPPYGDEEPF